MKSNLGAFKLLEVRSIKMDQKIEISIFPNPAKEQLNLSGGIPDNSPYQIFNAQGKLVRQGQLSSQRIDISSFPAGLYVLQLQMGSETIQHSFLKQN